MCLSQTGCNLLLSCFSVHPLAQILHLHSNTLHCVVVVYTTHTKQIHTTRTHLILNTSCPLIKDVGQDMEKQCHYTATDLCWCTTARHVSRPFYNLLSFGHPQKVPADCINNRCRAPPGLLLFPCGLHLRSCFKGDGQASIPLGLAIAVSFHLPQLLLHG